MLIGLKLDIGFAQDDVYRQLYGKREVLGYLGKLGVEAVETPVGPETSTAELREHIARCAEVGLSVSLHPYSEETIYNPAFFSADGDNPCRVLHERFLGLAAEAARLQGCSAVVNVHGAAGTAADSRRHLVDQSVRFLTWAGEWSRRNAPQVAVAVELQISPNADEPRQRVGDSYDELLEVAKAGGVPACWDFGHAYWNTRRFARPLYPPQELVARIGHVHCHDARDEDHQPLVYNAVPWRDFLKLLIDSGFDGRIILEVPPSEFLRAGGIRTLSASVEALRTWVQQCRSAALPR
jgi:sugar phosphate isomerase/epimerase